VTISEYLGGEIDEETRVKEITENRSITSLHTFTFDEVYDAKTTQSEVYETTCKPIVYSILEVSEWNCLFLICVGI
jgi:hypothetical protein